MFCRHCGKEIADDAVICVGCGREVRPLRRLEGNKWSGGVLALLIIGAIFIPFAGIIAGIVGLTQEAKRRQGILLLVIGLIIPAIGILSAIITPNLLIAVQTAKAKQTMSDMMSIGEALEIYWIDYDEYPPCNSFRELSGYLDPNYIRRLPIYDGWGNPFRYEVKEDSYFLISLGRDGIQDAFEPYTAFAAITDDFDDDIIFSNGAFIRYPENVRSWLR